MNKDTMQPADHHQQITLLLPWYLNQRLVSAQRQQVEKHIRGCMLCRRELVYLRKLAVTLRQASELDVAAEFSFDKLRAKLPTALNLSDSFASPQLDLWFEKRTAQFSGNSALRHESFASFPCIHSTRLAILISGLVAITLFVTQYAGAPAAGNYFTLSSAKQEAASGIGPRVFFSKPKLNTEIDSLLAKIHGQLILRSQQNVTLAEPVLPP